MRKRCAKPVLLIDHESPSMLYRTRVFAKRAANTRSASRIDDTVEEE